MRLVAAYLGIVLIWSTTSLALKWSAEAGFLAGVVGRMGVAAVGAGLLMIAIRRTLPLTARSIELYVAGGVCTFGTLILICWGARFIPSGWISVIFGLTPILTSILGALFLKEQHLSFAKLGALVLGLAGLAIIFGESGNVGQSAGWGIAANLGATLLYAVNLTWIKRLNANVDSMAAMTGTFYVGLLLGALAWGVTGGDLVDDPPIRAMGAVVYLALIGSIVGYTLFYYLLRHMDTTRIAMISLLTPISALLVGHFLNGEPLNAAIWSGTALVLLGLLWFEYTTIVAPAVALLRRRLRGTAAG
jgi:drug/metabolite transporter (DMT)-like permease